MVPFVGQRSRILGPALLPGLAPRKLAIGPNLGRRQSPAFLQPTAELRPRGRTISRLGALLLAPDLNPGRAMAQHDRGRRFIDLLAAGA